jgi:C4-dicarboxylate-specific signal transduction histidine kinase
MSPLTHLQNNPILGKAPVHQLEWLLEKGEVVSMAAGDYLFKANSPIEYFFVIFEGKFEVFTWQAGQRRDVFALEPGDTSGALPFSRGKTSVADAVASEPSLIYRLKREHLSDMIRQHYELTEALVHQMTDRVREMGKMQMVNEKMVSLGKLSAGLAHELNNPASAGLRAAGQLQPLFDEVQDVRAALERLDLTAEQESLVADFAARARQSAGRPAALDSLARADREEALERWLAQHGFPDGWRVAPTLVDLALDDAALGRLAAAFDPAQLPIFLHWLQHDYETQLLLREIAQTTSRVADIVDALKSYVFLDQGPLQDLDVHAGLENALIVLSQKLAPAVTIRREYDPDLPKITAYGSELNQVWTSLIDNAIDALDGLDGQGRITLRTNRAPGGIIVEIEDNGPGIPPDHLPKIFDPFFTTKPPGQGAGLGLSMSYNIIAGKHHGNIVASSQPGRTLFRVELPSAP